MTPFTRYTIVLFLLVFNSAQSSTPNPNYLNQLKAKQKQLKLETQAIKEQIQSEQVRIKQLAQRIKLFRAQNKAIDQQIQKKIEQYEKDGV